MTTLLKSKAQDEHSVIYALGQSVVGPLINSFCHWLHTLKKAQRIDSIWFLSREGHILHTVYKHLYPDETCTTEYVWISRQLVNRTLAIFSKNHVSAEQALSPLGHITLGDLRAISNAVPLKIRTSENKKKLKTFLKENPDQQETIRDWLNTILVEAENEGSTYLNYLRSISASKNSILVVDIGWHGSMQTALEHLLSHINFTGAYLGVFSQSTGNHLNGYAFQNNRPHQRYQAFKYSIELVEILFASIQCSIISLQKTASEFTPIEADYHEWGDDRPLINSLHRGILTYIETQSREPEPLSPEEALSPLIRLLTQPNLQEAQILGRLYIDNFGNAQKMQKQLAQPTMQWRYLLHLLKLRQDFKTSQWRAGFYRQLPLVVKLILKVMTPGITFSRS